MGAVTDYGRIAVGKDLKTIFPTVQKHKHRVSRLDDPDAKHCVGFAVDGIDRQRYFGSVIERYVVHRAVRKIGHAAFCRAIGHAVGSPGRVDEDRRVDLQRHQAIAAIGGNR